LQLDNHNLIFIQCDISNKEELKKWNLFFKDIDGIFHLGGIARIQEGVRNPQRTHEANVTGTFNILEMMRENGINKIVFSSSSSTYGLKNKCPYRENMPVDCLNPYSVSKYIAENYIRTYAKLYGISGINLRYFNVWGSREVLKGELAPVVGLFFRQILFDKSYPTIIGDGLQRRDLTNIVDVVDANIKAMYKNDQKFEGEVFNIGTGRNYNMLELADLILESLGIDKNKKIFIQKRPAELRETLADNSKALKILNWKPTIILEDEINNHRDYYLKKWDIK